MRLWPYRRYRLHSPLDANDALRRLNAALKPPLRFFGMYMFGDDEFHGEIIENRFKMIRMTSYRNGYQPVIEGEVLPVRRGCTVDITMRMYWIVIAFSIAWLGISAFGMVAALFMPGMCPAKICGGHFLIPAFFFIAFALLMAFCFCYEADKAERFLERVFEA